MERNERFSPSGVVQSFRTGECDATLWFPTDGIVAGRVNGRVRGPIATAAYRAIDRYAETNAHPGEGFCDLSGLVDFAWDARMVMVRWNLEHRDQAVRLHLLVQGQAVRVGLRLLSVALGDIIRVYDTRAEFDGEYSARLRHSARIERARASVPPCR